MKIRTDFTFVIDEECASVFENNKCATNGYYCVERKRCEDVYIQDGCTFDINNNVCLWTTTN